MQRYFVTEDQWAEKDITIIGDDVHHIQRVMRMSVGDEIVCIHPNKRAAVGKIYHMSPTEVKVSFVEWLKEDRELPVHVTIVQSLGKGDKLEQVVQKGTELGAHSFIPYTADRSVVKWDQKKSEKKIERLRKIAKEACEQSERLHIPEVFSLSNLSRVIEMSKEYDECLLAYEGQARHGSKRSLMSMISQWDQGQRVLLVIGPEGGFTNEEVESFLGNGFQAIRLGKRILRMETAPLYFLSAVSYQFEESDSRI